MFMKLLLTILLLLASSKNEVSSQSLSDVEKLMKDLFTDYQKEVRPINDQSKAIEVYTGVMLVSLSNFDEVAGKLSIVVVLTFSWFDHKLTWDPKSYGYAYNLVFPKSKLWTPEMFLVNPAEKVDVIGNDNFKVSLIYTGQVWWYTGDGITTSCEPDMTKFPFDTQTCNTMLMPWGYPETMVKLIVAEAAADLSRFTENGEWTLLEASCKIVNASSVSELYIKTTIKRKPTYFILSIILPVITLSLMNPLVFFLPVETGERVSFSITLSLSFAVFLSMTSDVIPQSSDPMALLTVFLFSAQAFSGYIVMINGAIILVYSQPNEKKIPKILCIIVRVYQKLCSCCVIKNKALVHPHQKQSEHLEKLDLQSVKDISFLEEDVEQYTSKAPIQEKDPLNWKVVGEILDKLAYVTSKLIAIAGSTAFIIAIAT